MGNPNDYEYNNKEISKIDLGSKHLYFCMHNTKPCFRPREPVFGNKSTLVPSLLTTSLVPGGNVFPSNVTVQI